MKELVEKLIKQLEERIEENHGWEDDEFFDGQSNAFEWTIKIIKELAKEYNNGWIPCSERLPDSSGNVIIMTRSSIVGVGSFFKNTNGWVQWYSGGGIAVDVIAWQPLPELYKELTT